MISFETKNVEMPNLDFEKIEIWLGKIAASFNKLIGNLNFLLCDDTEIISVNRQFLNHDYFTDIITFDYSRKNKVGGDIFISVETVKTNSEKFGEPYTKELLRVIVHGLLHLCGIKDKTPEERIEMELQENKALDIYEI